MTNNMPRYFKHKRQFGDRTIFVEWIDDKNTYLHQEDGSKTHTDFWPLEACLQAVRMGNWEEFNPFTADNKPVKEEVENLHTTSSDIIIDFSVLKNHLRWGTRGKDGTDPLTYVRLIDCSTEHLRAILATQYPSPDYKMVIRSIIEDRES